MIARSDAHREHASPAAQKGQLAEEGPEEAPADAVPTEQELGADTLVSELERLGYTNMEKWLQILEDEEYDLETMKSI